MLRAFFFVYLFSLLFTKSDTPHNYTIIILYLYKYFASAPKLYLKVIYKM